MGTPTSVSTKRFLSCWAFQARLSASSSGFVRHPSTPMSSPQAESREPAQAEWSLNPKEARKHPLEKKIIFIIPMMGTTTTLQPGGSRSWPGAVLLLPPGRPEQCQQQLCPWHLPTEYSWSCSQPQARTPGTVAVTEIRSSTTHSSQCLPCCQAGCYSP